MEERFYYLGFSLASGIGPKTFGSLLKYFKTAKRAWEAPGTDLKNSGLGEKTTQKFITHRNNFSFEDYQRRLKLTKVNFLALCDKTYPDLLKQIPNPPIVLYYKGNLKNVDFNKCIAVVGTRKITNYGKEITNLFSQDLAMSGLTVVSGLALGVDAIAGWGAVNVNGKTIAVMGNGVDLAFPNVNKPLYDKILDGNGIIVSEFPLGMTPTAGSFPSRNRIIAGLSLGVLVTEGAEDSGSLITADYAFKFNRKVFAVPGPITSSLSAAPLRLIEKGAKLVISAEDILKEFKIQNAKVKIASQKSKLLNLSKEEQKIVEMLENESLHFDEIVRRLKLDSSKAGIILSMMEIKGLIKDNGGNLCLKN